MGEHPRHYSTRELPWHAFQRLLAGQLEHQAHGGLTAPPLHSWLGRARECIVNRATRLSHPRGGLE